MMFFKQFGVGLAVAVLLDATIIRCVLLPAAMKLLGDWNWYLLRWLEWLPRLNPEAELDGEQAPSTPAATVNYWPSRCHASRRRCRAQPPGERGRRALSRLAWK